MVQSLFNTVEVTTSTEDANPDNNIADTEVPVEPAADLTVDKLGPATVVAGTSMTYTVLIANGGPSDALDVVVTDTLPAGVTLVDSSVVAGTGSCVAGVCTFPVVPAGTFASVEVQVDVDPFLTSTTTLTNTVDVTSSTPDPDPTTNTDDHVTDVEQLADLSVLKTVSLDPFVPGQPLTYTITVTNNGPSAAMNSTLDDQIPAGLTVTNLQSPVGSCSEDGVTISCQFGDVGPGQSFAVEVEAETDPSITTTVINTAIVDSDTEEATPGDESSTATTEPLPTADLEVTKTASPDPVVAGETLTYTMQLTNLGVSTARDVELVDALPPTVTYMSHTTTSEATCGYEAAVSTVRCSLEALPPGESIDLEVVVTVDPDVAGGSSISNTAGSSSSTPDPNPDNDTATEITNVEAVADVYVVKSLTSEPLVPGSSNQYQLVIGNNGPSSAVDTVVTDVVPDGLTIAGVTATVGTCQHDGTNLTCDLATVTPGQIITINVDVDVSSAIVDDVVNTAVVATTTTDSDISNNTSTTTHSPTPLADLVATKVTLTDPIVPGETVEYLISVSNAGPSDATGVTMADAMPDGLTAISATPQTGTCVVAADLVACDLGIVPATSSVNVTITALVAANITDPVTNTATTTSNVEDPDTTNNSDDVSNDVEPSADLELTKSSTPDPFAPGEPIVYTITVHNHGPSDATNVTMIDTLPAGVTVVAITTNAGSCTADGQIVECNFPTMPSGESFTITVEADTAPNLTDDVENSRRRRK